MFITNRTENNVTKFFFRGLEETPYSLNPYPKLTPRVSTGDPRNEVALIFYCLAALKHFKKISF